MRLPILTAVLSMALVGLLNLRQPPAPVATVEPVGYAYQVRSMRAIALGIAAHHLGTTSPEYQYLDTRYSFEQLFKQWPEIEADATAGFKVNVAALLCVRLISDDGVDSDIAPAVAVVLVEAAIAYAKQETKITADAKQYQ